MNALKTGIYYIILLGIMSMIHLSCQKDDHFCCVRSDFHGMWMWEESIGGFAGTRITRDSLEVEVELAVSFTDNIFTQWKDGKVIEQSLYSYETRWDRWGNVERLILLSSGPEYFVFLEKDTLELRETAFDGFSHYYTRQ